MGRKAKMDVDQVDESMAATVELTKDGVALMESPAEREGREGGLLPAEPFFKTVSDGERVAIELIAANGHNRTHSQAAIEQMAASLKAQGLLQNIGVVELADVGMAKKYGDAKYLLVFGERRLLAAKSLGWEFIHAKVLRPTGRDDAERMRSVTVGTAVENLEHAPPDSLEEAQAVAALIEKYRFPGDGLMTPAIRLAAAALGRSERWVRDRSWLAKLDPKGTAAGLLKAGRLTINGARMISTIADPRTQEHLAQELARLWDHHSIPDHDVQSEVSMRVNSLHQVPWDKQAELKGTNAPPCTACPKNSANDATLFEGMAGAGMRAVDYCLDPGCYNRKREWAEKRLKRAADRAAELIKTEVGRSHGDVAMPTNPEETASMITAVGRNVEGVDTGALAQAVSLKLAPEAKGSPALAAGEPRPKVNYDAMEKKRKEVEKAQKDWEEAATVAINKACEGQPTRLLGLCVLLHSKTFSDTRAENEKNRLKPVSGTSARAIAACLGSAKKPATVEQIAGFLKQDEALRSKWDRGLLAMLLHGRSHAAQAVVGDALGVRIDPMPTRKSLAAEKRADAAAEKKSKAPGRKSTTKGAKGKAAKGAKKKGKKVGAGKR